MRCRTPLSVSRLILTTDAFLPISLEVDGGHRSLNDFKARLERDALVARA
jgi:hypothetical protein